MRPLLIVCLLSTQITLSRHLVAGNQVFGVAALEKGRQTPVPPLSIGDRRDALDRLLSLLQKTDVSNGEALYEAQQEGMALAEAVFRFGSSADKVAVLDAAASLVRALPTAGTLAERSFVSSHIGSLELLAPALTKVRQRIGRLAFSIDGLPLPPGPSRTRRVFPILEGENIRVSSEIEMQYVYLLSTILRLSTEKPIYDDDRLLALSRASMQTLFAFVLRDKVEFYWKEAPAWHWSGPFRNMQKRVALKLEQVDSRVTKPPWFGAVVDHELHLFAVAADLMAAASLDKELARLEDREDISILKEIRASTLEILRTRVSAGRQGDGFLFDFGYWTTNPSYRYSGCVSRSPIPRSPCPIQAVATDVSHARRWPWWLESFANSWEEGSPGRQTIRRLQQRLATQFVRDVVYTDARGRPLTRNFMDGRDGWYRLKEFPDHPWGHGPSSMTGALRYGSWAMLSPYNPRIATIQQSFCRVVVSTDRTDIAFRTLYYGSASSKPKMAGLGETDLYGPGSLYALTCRVGAARGLYTLAAGGN